MSEPYLGEIRMAGFNFAPRGWALCNGQLVSIAQNSALFALLGTTYGGDGQTTFALPDLRGRVPIHWGTGPGLTNRVQGEVSGTETCTLIANQMPAHNHLINAQSAAGTTTSPSGAYLAGQPRGGAMMYASTPDSNLSASALSVAGGNQPHNNMQPYLAVTFIIALNGIFPSRN